MTADGYGPDTGIELPGKSLKLLPLISFLVLRWRMRSYGLLLLDLILPSLLGMPSGLLVRRSLGALLFGLTEMCQNGPLLCG